MYEITSELINKSSQSYIDPGVNSNIEITEIKGEKSPNGNVFMSYTYTNELGQYITRTEWEVRELPNSSEWSPKLLAMMEDYTSQNKKDSEGKPLSKKDSKGNPLTLTTAPAHYIEAKRKAQMRRIMEVATQFVKEEELTGQSFETYLDFVTFIKEKIGEKNKGVKLRVKFTYDSRGYVNTPDYVRKNTPWIERMDAVTGENSKIIITSGLDKLTTVAKGSRPNQTEKNPLEEAPKVLEASALKKDSDLPF